jgi:hypothetical protein
MAIEPGDCVKIPDGRIGRVRDQDGDHYRVRVMRKTSHTHQFLKFPGAALTVVPCPKGWMSREGYIRYLETTLAKMRQRSALKKTGS